MKPIRITIIVCAFLFVGLLFNTVFAQDSGSIFTVSGIVKDKKTNKAIEYVNVSVKGSNVGTITNADGTFLLKVKRSNQPQHILEVSSLGYTTAQFAIAEDDVSNKAFYLQPNSVLLKEVEVLKVDAKTVVEQAIGKIPDNYNRQISLNTGFYRETIQKGKRFIQISEAVAKVLKGSYKEHSVGKDRIKVFKGRKLLSPKPDDTLAVKLEGGPTQSIYLDLAKNPDAFTNDFQFYNYKFNDYAVIDGRTQYVISFAPAVKTTEPLYTGILYIDKENLTLSRAELNMDVSDKDKASTAILKKKPAGLRFTPTKISYLISYKRAGEFSSLSYVRSEIKFKCDWKRKLFATNYTVISEFAVTDRVDSPAETILWKDSFRNDDVLSDKVENFYDEKFWGDYNIIEPTESLEKAVFKLKK